MCGVPSAAERDANKLQTWGTIGGHQEVCFAGALAGSKFFVEIQQLLRFLLTGKSHIALPKARIIEVERCLIPRQSEMS